MKFFVVLCIISLATFASVKAGNAGSARSDNLKAAEEVIDRSLSRLATTAEGPFYSVIKINSVTLHTELFNGDKYKITAELLDLKTLMVSTCRVEILEQKWNIENTKVTIKCRGKEREIRRYNA